MTTEYIHTDVLVIGAGAAGLVTALSLAPLNVTVLAKAPAGEGSSSGWAQGGIAAAVGRGDNPEHHMHDTLDVGGGLSCEEAARVVTHSGPEAIDALLRWGVRFDRDAEGALSLGREAAHSFRRILHAHGDGTGKEIMRALAEATGRMRHIRLLSHVTAHDLIVRNSLVQGARGNGRGGRGSGRRARDNGRGTRDNGTADREYLIRASAVVLATGGVGNLFGHTTNPAETRGDGLAMAARVGARLADLEFVQFHPTAIDVGKRPMPLATEALRGEGARLIDQNGFRFMPSVHRDAELAPRDVVARAIWRRLKDGDTVYLDCRTAVGDAFPERFPTVFRYCTEAGLDPRKQPIPVTPAAHYHMGGVDVDLGGRSSLPGLWAVGEVACTGLHGANRLASNSLLEAVVFGCRAARDILKQHRSTAAAGIDPVAHRVSVGDAHQKELPEEGELADRLARLLYDAAGVERSAAALANALARVAEWESCREHYSPAFGNRLITAKMILACALMRRESRGGHHRTDHSVPRDAFARRTIVTLEEIDAFVNSLGLRADNEGVEKPCPIAM